MTGDDPHGARRRAHRPRGRHAHRLQPHRGVGSRRRRHGHRRRRRRHQAVDRACVPIRSWRSTADPHRRERRCPRPTTSVVVPVVLRRRRHHRHRQAGRPGRAPRRRPPRRHAGQRAAGPLPRDRRRSASRTGPASCTASTRARRACWSWPAPRRPTTTRRASSPTHEVDARVPRRWCGASPTRRDGHDRRADRPVAPQPAQMTVSADGRGGPHPLRGRSARFDRSGRDARAQLPARDRSHPPDPGAPRAPSATRWWATSATAAAGRRSTSTARSSTPRRLRFDAPGHRRAARRVPQSPLPRLDLLGRARPRA